MNLATIEARTYARLGWDSPNPGAAIVTRIRGFINETYRELIGRKGFERYRRQSMTMFALIGKPYGYIGPAVSRIHSIRDTVNNQLLEEVALADIRTLDAGDDSSGPPTAYALYDMASATLAQPDPLVPSTLYIKSTSASDGASKRAYIQGIDAFGYPVNQSVALNGTTEVVAGSSIMHTVTRFYIQVPATQGLSAIIAAVGYISLYQTSGGIDAIAIIPPGQSESKYSVVAWSPIPNTTYGLTADVDAIVYDLVEEGDTPLLPEDYHWLLSSGAAIKEYTRREKSVEAAIETRRFKDGLGELIMFTNRQPANPARGRRGGHQWSQLGPWFPAGT